MSFVNPDSLDRTIALLESLAKSGRTMTYGEAALELGCHHRSIRFLLAPIQAFCAYRGLPCLTVLIINQTLGRPGRGCDHAFDSAVEIPKVCAFDWSTVDFPSGRRLRLYQPRAGHK